MAIEIEPRIEARESQTVVLARTEAEAEPITKSLPNFYNRPVIPPEDSPIVKELKRLDKDSGLVFLTYGPRVVNEKPYSVKDGDSPYYTHGRMIPVWVRKANEIKDEWRLSPDSPLYVYPEVYTSTSFIEDEKGLFETRTMKVRVLVDRDTLDHRIHRESTVDEIRKSLESEETRGESARVNRNGQENYHIDSLDVRTVVEIDTDQISVNGNGDGHSANNSYEVGNGQEKPLEIKS